MAEILCHLDEYFASHCYFGWHLRLASDLSDGAAGRSVSVQSFPMSSLIENSYQATG